MIHRRRFHDRDKSTNSIKPSFTPAVRSRVTLAMPQANRSRLPAGHHPENGAS
jgi:hypothetical protein